MYTYFTGEFTERHDNNIPEAPDLTLDPEIGYPD
jgi:hypothetical protein